MSDIVNAEPESVSPSREQSFREPARPVDFEVETPNEREGLPRGYRMRADKHYVDQLTSRSAGHPVRHLGLHEIDAVESMAAADLGPLLESIRMHGIVHPLIVRRVGSRFAVVAGRKRLAAARILRFNTVPCMVHDLDDATAAALASADNVTATSPRPTTDTPPLAVAVGRLVAEYIGMVRTCSDLAKTTLPSMNASVQDLVQAYSWRAARLLDVLDLIGATPAASRRDRPVSVIIEDVVEGFGPESRAGRFALQAEVDDAIAMRRVDVHDLFAGLAGALLATIPLLDENRPEPGITLRLIPGGRSLLAIELVLHGASVSGGTARRFFDEDSSERAGGWCAVAGALAAKALAEQHGGTATFEAGANGASLLRLTLAQQDN